MFTEVNLFPVGDVKIYDLLSETYDQKFYFNAQKIKMRTKQGTDFVSLLYAKQILTQK